MTHARKSRFAALTALAGTLLALPVAAVSQMHRVTRAEDVTRAVGVYEYVGDPVKPRAARLIPVSLFIGGHFEDAGVYLARPIPFALDTGLRYELQKGGVTENVLDLVAARNFAGSEVAARVPFEDGWFGYGRVSSPKAAKPGRIRPNCGNARVVEETPQKKDDGKPRFGSKPPESRPSRAAAAPDPCRDEDPVEKINLADDARNSPQSKDAADPERPTLHRSTESSAHNTGAEGKPDKKAPKPPPATVTANSSPGDDPDRPTIRRRASDEDDPNGLPPDPLELAGREAAKARSAAATDTQQPQAAPGSNDTVAEGGSISGGDTMSGGPVLRRGKPSAAPADLPRVTATAAVVTAPAPPPTAPALPALVAVSDAKDHPAHDFRYRFANDAERSTATATLEQLAQAVLSSPSLATDAPATTATSAPVPAAQPRTTRATGRAVRNRTAAPARPATMPFLDAELNAYQLYFSAPITYTYFARVAATASQPERYVTVVAQTDAEGHLQPAMRSVTDTAHMDRIPRYRPIDVVDADGSNRASLLLELRSQRVRQFALYRLLGNKPDQIFLSGTTLL